MQMRQSIVGTYDLGAESVELYVRPGTGADFSTHSGTVRKRQIAAIYVGMDYATWDGVVTCLLHEAKEAVEMRMGVRLRPDIDFSRDAAGWYFFSTHAQHSEMCARVGYFLAQCLPDVERIWKQWRKPPKKGKHHGKA
jgi:hypothetical protein